MLRTYLHGTTQRGLDAIRGGTGKQPGPWECSDTDGFTYLWDLQEVLDGEGYDEEVDALRTAFEAGQIQAAVDGEDTTLYVLVVQLDDSIVNADTSCENMWYAYRVAESAMCMARVVRMYRCPFSKWHAPFVLAGLLDQDTFADYNVADSAILKLAAVLQAEGTYLEDVLDFDFEAV